MKEYIERASVHSIIEQTSTLTFTRGRMHEQIDSLPAADVAEVRHGRWLDVREENSSLNWKCSLCAKRALQKSPYCPNCGARMEKEDEIE